ncbi:MAG: PTS fructose transporter subunit IIA [Gammaproteobacteria bacterium]|nr:MAG: PTS fructose transporter subunit IIA [Gammaproteobacteria bacterium]
MTIGLLLITHGETGAHLLATARTMLGVCPLETEALGVSFDCDPDRVLEEAERLAARLGNAEDGLLVLTDMYGSTPANIACRIQMRYRARVVAGLNLPMLVRVLNYPTLSLDELAEKAVSGGRDGVVVCRLPEGAP